jgi:Protein of unknown function (DUF402)
VGDLMLKRSIYRGKVRWTYAHRFAGGWGDRIGIYCGPGYEGKGMRRGPEGYLKHWLTDSPPYDMVWEGAHVLRFERPGASHSIEIYWHLDWSLLGWYVNLQSPLVVTGNRLDTTDWVLDITVSPDGVWEWKDEEELEESVELGIFDAGDVAAVRAEGERVLGEPRPWPTGWEDWRPPAGWGPLRLPDDWHVV